MIFWLFLLDTTHHHFYGLIQAVQCKSWQLLRCTGNSGHYHLFFF
ncbi:hypothetical protein SFy_4645 [Shigella flexneri 2003036]|nr:hypothetical protein SFy_4645 [Shigella flexneri 2003036]